MEAIKRGAYNYITKPFKLDEIKVAVQNVSEKIQLVRKNQELFDSLTQS
jgi:DNA-binding NtrC family response regulator